MSPWRKTCWITLICSVYTFPWFCQTLFPQHLWSICCYMAIAANSVRINDAALLHARRTGIKSAALLWLLLYWDPLSHRACAQAYDTAPASDWSLILCTQIWQEDPDVQSYCVTQKLGDLISLLLWIQTKSPQKQPKQGCNSPLVTIWSLVNCDVIFLFWIPHPSPSSKPYMWSSGNMPVQCGW